MLNPFGSIAGRGNTPLIQIVALQFEATQQAKHLAPTQTDQLTGIGHTQSARLNPQQHLEPAEFLFAHRQHRHDASPATPKPGRVSSLCCRGVPSLYCAYTIELSNKSWVLAAQVPGLTRVKAKQTIEPTAEALLAPLQGYRERAKAARPHVEPVISTKEAGWSGLWLARLLATHGVETHV
ncbi:MAG: transposase, partial [Gammaproteobacteria bacterium]|nr:transposase [Gammaproteobacteria bacterium]